LELADGALIIGDPALHLDPGMTEWRGQPLFVYDLGAEWVEMTGQPMVFAVWAVKNLVADAGDPAIFQASADYGLAHVDEIVEQESVARGYTKELTHRYLTEYISYDFGPVEQRSLETFLRAAADLGIVEKMPELSYLEAPAVAGQTS